MDDFDALARTTPLLANIRPSGQYLMEDFYYAGGLRALHQNLSDRLDLAALTVNGKTLGENVADAKVFNDDVIRTLGHGAGRLRHAGRAAREPRARWRGDQTARRRSAAASAHRQGRGVRRLQRPGRAHR